MLLVEFQLEGGVEKRQWGWLWDDAGWRLTRWPPSWPPAGTNGNNRVRIGRVTGLHNKR